MPLRPAFYCSFQLPVVIARPFNTYGPRQSARAVIPTIISQIAAGAQKVRLGDLSTTRDFTFVDDTCRGFLAIGSLESGFGEVFHIGSDQEISIADLFSLIAQSMNSQAQIEMDSDRLRPIGSEVLRLRCTYQKLREASGFQPEISLRELACGGRLIGLETRTTFVATKDFCTMSKRAVVLAGGIGTRLRPYTVVLPKPLMPIGDYPILEVIVRQLVWQGFTRITLAVNHQANIIKAFFEDGNKWGVSNRLFIGNQADEHDRAAFFDFRFAGQLFADEWRCVDRLGPHRLSSAACDGGKALHDCRGSPFTVHRLWGSTRRFFT